MRIAPLDCPPQHSERYSGGSAKVRRLRRARRNTVAAWHVTHASRPEPALTGQKSTSGSRSMRPGRAEKTSAIRKQSIDSTVHAPPFIMISEFAMRNPSLEPTLNGLSAPRKR